MWTISSCPCYLPPPKPPACLALPAVRAEGRAVKKIFPEVVFRLEYFGWGLAKESGGEWAGRGGGLGVVIHHPEKNPGFETRGKHKEKNSTENENTQQKWSNQYKFKDFSWKNS